MCDTTVKRQKIDKLFVDIPEQEQVLYWVVVEITTFFGMKTEIVYNNLRHIIAEIYDYSSSPCWIDVPITMFQILLQCSKVDWDHFMKMHHIQEIELFLIAMYTSLVVVDDYSHFYKSLFDDEYDMISQQDKDKYVPFFTAHKEFLKYIEYRVHVTNKIIEEQYALIMR